MADSTGVPSSTSAEKVELPRDLKSWFQITENSATIYYKDKNEVFYNDVQETNRDLSIAVIRVYQRILEKEKITRKRRRDGMPSTPTSPRMLSIFEALSATGLRSIRYFNEITNDSGEHLVKQVVANDLDEAAVKAIQRNVVANGLDLSRVVPSHGDANQVMYTSAFNKTFYDVVDLDPYGSAAPFLDAALRVVSHGGILCITCTDLIILCGKEPDTCYNRYGGWPAKTSKITHEVALRLLLNVVERTAVNHKKTVEPLTSLFVDFYIRVFVRVRSSGPSTKLAPARYATAYKCTQCATLDLQHVASTVVKKNGDQRSVPSKATVSPSCEECGGSKTSFGPIYSAPLYDPEFVDSLIEEVEKNKERYKAHDRILTRLRNQRNELRDVPLFYTLDEMARFLKTTTPRRLQVEAAIHNHGYRVSGSHTCSSALKTDAPASLLWDIMKKLISPTPKGLKEGTPPHILFHKPPRHDVNLEISEEERAAYLKEREAPRFLENPNEFWGPGSRAHGGRKKDTPSDNPGAPPAAKDDTIMEEDVSTRNNE